MRHVLCVAALLAVGSVAGADDTERARAHFFAGKHLAGTGDHRGAIEEFQKALLVKETANIVYNLAFEHYALVASGEDGSVKPAWFAFRRYLALNPQARDRTVVEGFIAKLDLRIAVIAAEEQRKEEQRVAEGNAREEAAARERRETEARAKQAAEATAGQAGEAPIDRATQQRRLVVASAMVALSNRAPPRASPAGSSRPGSKRRIVGGVVIGLGAVVAAVGASLLWASTLEAESGRASTKLEPWNRHYDMADSLRAAGGGLIAAGALALVAGVVVLALPVKTERQVRIWIVPSTSGAAIGGVF